MSNTTGQLAFISAWTGTGFGLFLLVIPLSGYLFNSKERVANFYLLFAALGVYFFLFGLPVLLGAKSLRNYPRLGASLLFSAVGGCIPLFTTIIWLIPGVIELVAATRALRETSKTKNLSLV